MNAERRIMRDVFIDKIFQSMKDDDGIFFLSADFGSPALDKIRRKFPERFINVGIAEQNLINVSTGLALEGFTVYAYAIAPFLTMRAFEQIRINLAIHAQSKDLNVNLIGVGAGLSYDVSGPTHHCLEDISVIRTLPNVVLFSPSDWILTDKFFDYSLNVSKPKYLRFDGKPLPVIYEGINDLKLSNGFYEIKGGKDLCFVSTGYMTHTAVKASDLLSKENIEAGIIDVFLLDCLDETLLFETLSKYKYLITIEEAFVNKGGLDTLISCLIMDRSSDIKLLRLGFKNKYVFDIGGRNYLHRLNGLDELSIAKNAKNFLEGY